MSYIETNNKYDSLQFHFDDSDPRDRERAFAKLLKSWWDCEYFYESAEVYVSENDKPLIALSDEEVDALPDVFKVTAKAARKRHAEALGEISLMNKYYEIVKVLVNSGSPEAGLQAVEEKFGFCETASGNSQSWVNVIAEHFSDYEYQEWSICRSKTVNNSTWAY